VKILVVDDEPSVRLSLSRALSLKGHEVKQAQDGIEGLQMWRQWQPEIVLLDVLMPGLSGPAVLQEVGLDHKAKVLLMSAYSGDYDLERARAMGADRFLAKPFADIFAVVALIEELGNGGK
jgi:two-component system, response regulator PdtaR